MIWSVHYYTERWRRNNDRASGFVKRCSQFLQSAFTTYLQVPFYVMGKKFIYISSATASNNMTDHANSYTKICEFFTNRIEMLKLLKKTTLMRLLRKERGYRLDAVGLKPSCGKGFCTFQKQFTPPPPSPNLYNSW